MNQDDEYMQTVRKAHKDLRTLRKEDFIIIKSYHHPPKTIQSVCSLVAILLGHEPNWKSAQTLLSEHDLLDLLHEYDIECVRPDLIERMKPIISDPNLTIESASKCSKAIGSLFKWVQAIYEYALSRQNHDNPESTFEETRIIEGSNSPFDSSFEL